MSIYINKCIYWESISKFTCKDAQSLHSILYTFIVNFENLYLLWENFNAKKEKDICSFLSLKHIHSSGPAMKSQGLFHPILLSPARISELTIVTKTSDGKCPLFLVDVNEMVPVLNFTCQVIQSLLIHLSCLAYF